MSDLARHSSPSLPLTLLTGVVYLCLLTGAFAESIPATEEIVDALPPKLVVQITVDQLRGDLPTRYLDDRH